MTGLPKIKWAQLTMRNPDRRWWQFWKPKRVLATDRLIDVLNQHNELLEELAWVDSALVKENHEHRFVHCGCSASCTRWECETCGLDPLEVGEDQ